MSALEDVLGAYSPGFGLDHQGKRYVFSRIDQKTKAALSAAYFERARQGVYVLRDLCNDSQYEGLLRGLAEGYRRGEYAFPQGESYTYYLTEGLAEMVRHLTGCAPDDAAELVSERQVDVMHVVLCVTVASFPDLKKKILQMEASGLAKTDQIVALLLPTPTNGSATASEPATRAPY